jgi:hypothetical protein
MRAGCSAAFAATMASAIFGVRNFAYTVSFRVPRQPIAAGAECVCVALTIMRSTGMPHCFAAMPLASSMSDCSIMQVSTMAKAIFILPSSSTKLRTKSLSASFSPRPSRNPPAMMRGNSVGEMSTVATPAGGKGDELKGAAHP